MHQPLTPGPGPLSANPPRSGCCVLKSQIKKVPPRNSASRKCPLKLVCEMAGAIFDSTTGKLLEYCHLIQHPNYRQSGARHLAKKLADLYKISQALLKALIPSSSSTETKFPKTNSKTVPTFDSYVTSNPRKPI